MVEKEKSVVISDAYHENCDDYSLQQILLKIDGGKLSKKKSKLINMKKNTKRVTKSSIVNSLATSIADEEDIIDHTAFADPDVPDKY